MSRILRSEPIDSPSKIMVDDNILLRFRLRVLILSYASGRIVFPDFIS